MEKLIVKVNYKHKAKWTDEEKYSFMVEGKMRVPQPKNKKVYKRKAKYASF